MRRFWAGIYNIEDRLRGTEVKNALPHGQFESWCSLEFEWSINYAQKYMKEAREIPKADDRQFFNGMKMTALYQLASGLANADEETKEKILEGVEQRTEVKAIRYF
ncbi:hypothetical protein [Cyanobacterium sp. Dongsha4]|uniref:hypothetical protein n=1 Tax=Cyanobacterium sp. DS4 TaxID=2878255 RepID=UPI002E812AD0|nr:hypothetical protein [Cyanobacterium sp. Dongsha4]WVL02504.1 hypothetical protein Dongsha4_18720 [Cyanobacterium sp. Dongsha4]